MSPRESLLRFFEFADDRRYLDMAWVFGTADGPYIETVEPSVAEKQMYLLGCMLRGVEREVLDELPIAGSVGSKVSFSVRMSGNGHAVSVPFVAVRSNDGRWFIQQFHYEVITASQLPPARECLTGPGRAR